MRLWTLQAPEVMAAVRDRGVHRADWDRVTINWRPAYRAMVDQLERRGIECAGAPPVWCWPGRARQRRRVRITANMLLGLDQWAHGVELVILDVPDRLTLMTSYARWNDYLGETMALLRAAGATDGPAFPAECAPMDWRPTVVGPLDERQVVIPEIRAEWVLRSRSYPPDGYHAARIAADPVLWSGQRRPATALEIATDGADSAVR